MTALACCDRNRAREIRASGESNGIDFLEVLDGRDVPDADRQRVLFVHLIHPPSPELLALSPEDVRIDGGVRVTGIRVLSLAWDDRVLTVRVDRPGDFSVYTLHVAPELAGTPAGLDPLLSHVDFSFKVDCPADFDCRDDCPPQGREDESPEIDYLARDYAGFRTLMLDRLSALVPTWTQRSPADLGIALVELLAHAADHVSYRLDAVGMESTLATARRRTSAARHARLVDHRPSDGSNARAWVQVRATAGQAGVGLPRGTQLLTRVPRLGPLIAPDSPDLREAMAAQPVVFETQHDATLDARLNVMAFHTWGDDACVLPAGATTATLAGHPPLATGDVVVLLEAVGAVTGLAADADPARRHAVRLIDVAPTEDPLGGRFADPPSSDPAPVTRITWHDDDALAFPLCLSARTALGLLAVAEARGNVVLADHGRTTIVEGFSMVPPPVDRAPVEPAGCGCGCTPPAPRSRPARYTPRLPEADVTMGATIGRALPGDDPRAWAAFDPGDSATSALAPARHVLPRVELADGDDRRWLPARELLGSGAFSAEFVVEVDDGARIRFGDGEYGMRPAAGTTFDLTYRVGSGPAGNIGAGALAHVVTDDPRIESATNLVAATGGTRAEPIVRTRSDAPAAFLVPERAVTAADYATMAARHPQVQRAVATERYTGSWYTVFLTVDRRGGRRVDAGFEAELRAFLERYRMAGHDLEIDGPRFVGLAIELGVCVLPDYYRADVARAVRARLGSGLLPDGRPAFFHPDRFTFGQPVPLSALLAAAQEVDGVHFVESLAFRRRGGKDSGAQELTMGRLEIARCDNDPNFVERGTLELVMGGGR